MAKKKVDFSGRFQKLYTEAHQFLKDNIKLHQVIVFAKESDVKKSENYDLLNELPNANVFGKHGDYSEYAILSIERTSKTDFEIVCFGKGEAHGDGEELTLGELTELEVIFLADEVAIHLKK